MRCEGACEHRDLSVGGAAPRRKDALTRTPNTEDRHRGQTQRTDTDTDTDTTKETHNRVQSPQISQTASVVGRSAGGSGRRGGAREGGENLFSNLRVNGDG